MATFLLAALIFGILFAGMAIGVIFQNKPIKGTCGGLNQMSGESCEICGGDPNKCDSEEDTAKPKADPAVLTYDATKSR